VPSFQFFPWGVEREINRLLLAVARRGAEEARRLAPKDTGRLVQSLRADEGDRGTARIYMIDYTWYQEEGTGLYGPRRAYIYPRYARYLVWRVREKDVVWGKYPGRQAGDIIRARRVRGVPARKFIYRGLQIAARTMKSRRP
jgi:hypothetical protein